LLLVRQAEDELRAAGGRSARRALRGVDALTPSELRISQLAAGGATNREIGEQLYLTVKTIEMHLSNAYRKLGIESRRELPGALKTS
jgi:DNA-binding CsgD family transcriptional regulator